MRVIFRIVLIILAIIILAMVVTGISIYQYSSTESHNYADAAIVLGAAVWRGSPSPVFAERINHAINLYQENRVEYLIFTGGIGQNDTISEAEAGKQTAIEAGIDQGRLIIDDESNITYENILNARSLASEFEISSFIIVSDPLHMKRAITIAEDLDMVVYPSPTPTSRYISWRTKLPFLIRESYFLLSYNIRSFLHLVGE
jgi:uncharacterized SAM-binding protein YcdF (DUF218 family)